MALNISVAAEPIFAIGGIVITNSLLTSWIVTILLIFFAIYFSRTSLVNKPKALSLQNFLEIVIGGLLAFFSQMVGERKAKIFFPLVASLFFFILFGNWFGLLPGVGSLGLWEELHGEKVLVPLFRASTADINTTLALAVVSVVSIQFFGFKTLGTKYLHKFFNFKDPIFFLIGLLELLSEFTKIISFAFRLFGNIFAGEVLLAVMAFLMPFLVPLPFLGMEVFVGLIQALVFAMLTIVFLRSSTSEHH